LTWGGNILTGGPELDGGIGLRVLSLNKIVQLINNRGSIKAAQKAGRKAACTANTAAPARTTARSHAAACLAELRSSPPLLPSEASIDFNAAMLRDSNGELLERPIDSDGTYLHGIGHESSPPPFSM
jgi:hypothetical protein